VSKQLKLSKTTKQIMTFIMIIVVFATIFMVIKINPPPTSSSSGGTVFTGEKTVKVSITIKVYTKVEEDDNWWKWWDSTIKEQVIKFDFTENDIVAQYIRKGYTISEVEVKELKFYAKASGGYKEAYVKVDICGKSKTIYSPTGSIYELNIYETVYSSKVTATVTVYVYAKDFCTPKIVAKDFTLTATVYLAKEG